MNNRINEIRRKISALRGEMARVEETMRSQINQDLDCTESALRLTALRADILLMVDEWKTAGGSDRLPTVEERLKVFNRTAPKLKASPRR
jgi:hypothetical protein